MASARNLRANQNRLDTVLRLGAGTRRIQGVVRGAVAELHDDRDLTPDLERMRQLVNGRGGDGLLRAVRGGNARGGGGLCRVTGATASRR